MNTDSEDRDGGAAYGEGMAAIKTRLTEKELGEGSNGWLLPFALTEAVLYL